MTDLERLEEAWPLGWRAIDVNIYEARTIAGTFVCVYEAEVYVFLLVAVDETGTIASEDLLAAVKMAKVALLRRARLVYAEFDALLLTAGARREDVAERSEALSGDRHD